VIGILLAWWILPITLIAFWFRYLKRHDWIGTSFHIVLAALSAVVAIALYWSAVGTLSGKERKPFQFKTQLKDITICKLVLLGVGFMGLLSFILREPSMQSQRVFILRSIVLRTICTRANTIHRFPHGQGLKLGFHAPWN